MARNLRRSLLWCEIQMAMNPRESAEYVEARDAWMVRAWKKLLAAAMAGSITACNTVPAVVDPPEPPNVSQCLLGPTPDVPAPPLFAP